MKPDVLTITTIIFVIGVIISSFNITSAVGQQNDVTPPPALHQGVAFVSDSKLS